MNHLYKVDPLLTKKLTRVAIIEEGRVAAEQTSLLAERVKEQVQGFTEAELEFLHISLLAIYDSQESKDYYIEAMLHLVDQQLKIRRGK